MKKLALFALTSTFALSVQAAPEVYTVDSTHTFPHISYTHLGYSKQQIRFDKTTGSVVYDKEAKTGAVDVVIDMKSVSTGSTLFNEHIQGDDFFDTEKHPTATFKSTRVEFEGDRPVRLDGNLTIKGITRPVSLAVTSFANREHPMLKRDAIGANATTTIKRSDFKVDKNAPFVSDEVTLTIALEAVRK